VAWVLKAEDASPKSQKEVCLRPEHLNKKQNACPKAFFWASRAPKEEPFSISITRSMEAVRRLGEAILHSPSDVVDTAAESLWIPR
jgi:hypothetical protein